MYNIGEVVTQFGYHNVAVGCGGRETKPLVDKGLERSLVLAELALDGLKLDTKVDAIDQLLLVCDA
jgi:hypothetical protein